MKRALILWIGLLPLLTFGQTYIKHTLQKDKLSIQLSEGTLNIVPLSAKAIRIQWIKDIPAEKQEFVFINKLEAPSFKVTETTAKLKLSTSVITVSFNKQNGVIDYSDSNGKVFLSEKVNGRKLTTNAIM